MNFFPPPAAARSLGAIRALRAQTRCQGNPTHDALHSYSPCLVVKKLFHVNIAPIPHILNLKLALDHSFMEKYPRLTRALFEELFACPRRSRGLSPAPDSHPGTPSFHGPWQVSDLHRAAGKCPPGSGSPPVKRILLFQPRKSTHPYKAKKTHAFFNLSVYPPPLLNQSPRALADGR